MLSITYILNKDYIKFIIFFTLGYVGMIYSHLVLTLFFTILLIIFLIIHIKELFNIKTILSFIISVITVLSITSPFLIPMFEHKVSGDYVVFRDGEMTNIQKIENNRLSMDEIFNKNTDKVVIVYNNIIVLAFSAITLVNLKNIVKDKSRRKFIIGIFIFTLVSIFISSEFVNWRNVPEIFWLIQFPWRMCMFIAFGTSIIGGLGILYFKKENFKVLFLIILVICLLDASAVSHYRELRIEPEINRNYVSNIDSFSLGGCREYLPVKSKENIEYLQKRTKKVEIIDGKANVKIIKNNTPYIKFEIKLDSDSAKIELPRIYYLGYDIKIKDENGKVDGIVHAIAHANTEDLHNDFIYTSKEGFSHANDVSAYSFVLTCRMAKELDMLNENASIISLTYIGSVKVLEGYNVMGVAKAALESSVRYLASNLGRENIRVNAVSAGPIKTLSAKGIKDFNSILDIVEQKAPLHKNVTNVQVGNVTTFLLSNMSDSITGQIIYADNGYSIIGV